MHFDESRDPQALARLRYQAMVKDPESEFASIAGLSTPKQQVVLAQLLTERDELKRQVSKSSKELKIERSKASRAESQRKEMAKKLAALRKSKTMTAGRALTAPVRFAKDPRKELTSWGVTPDKVKNKAKREVKSKLPRLKNLTNRTQDKKTRVGWIQRSGGKLGATEFEAELNELWYRHGSITKSIELIRSQSNPEALSAKTQILIPRIEGAYRLLKQDMSIPQRPATPAFVTEPGRIMYCVHSSPVFNSNGYSTRTRGIAEGLAAAGADVITVARPGYPWDSSVDVKKPSVRRYEAEIGELTYVHTPGGNLNRDPLDYYMMQSADALVREARLIRPSLIQSASNHRTALPALIAARRIGVPFVYEVRGLWELTEASSRPQFEGSDRFELMKHLEILVAREADSVLAITSQVAEELIRRGVDADKIVVVPNAVDTERFLPLRKDSSFAESKQIETHYPIIGFAGSMVAYEGLDLLVEASEILGQRGVEHGVVLAGSGVVEPALKRQAQELPHSNVTFVGRLPQDEIPQLLSLFDIVACPRTSEVITELVSPLKPLEAYASGKATVLSDVAPNIDLAGEVDTPRALLFEKGSAEALADALQELIENEQLRQELGMRARLWTVTERNWPDIGSLIIEAHRTARTHSIREQTEREWKTTELTVGVIGDEFTRTTLAGSFDSVLLNREHWREQLNQISFDLIFVESAWEGNNGQWHRGVGFYSEEESSDLRQLLEFARSHSIPTVFWNKEDPIHFARFAPNAALFDHVFTTDANMIPKYLATPGQRNLTVSAMPFYAQPQIHNPLPVDREFHSTYAYAGTYYGERYAERSKGLDALLEAAQPFGLEIYDRQANNPDSPYKFPARLSRSVVGALPYGEVIDSYSTHIGHLNVNSVTNSPTMFSRRVVEIPACGGLVISAPARGIGETLGSNIPTSLDKADLKAWMLEWSTDPDGRLQEIWRQMRTIYRAHTTFTAMAIMCRTAGLSVNGIVLPSYAITANTLTLDQARLITGQSVPAREVAAKSISDDARDHLLTHSIKVISSAEEISTDYVAALPCDLNRTFFEDLLLPTNFSTPGTLTAVSSAAFDSNRAVVQEGLEGIDSAYHLTQLSAREQSDGSANIAVILPDDLPRENELRVNGEIAREIPVGATILVAGHDLKFAQGLIRFFETQGYNVLLDQWDSHSKHDEDKSFEFLKQADIVFCEWGLGNAVWYSHHVSREQRLIVRVHSQELKLPFLRQIDATSVDEFIFVGEFIRHSAVVSHGIPAAKTKVVPNPVSVTALDLPKEDGAEFGVGFVGMVPQAKRLDLALDVIEQLVEIDPRYHLRLKGKTPEDYPWMKNRPEEMRYYEHQRERIEQLNKARSGTVIFDGYGSDMEQWYRKVGTVISTSDFESFHLTLADGAASGAMPVSLNWPGADQIYPQEWLVPSAVEMTQAIVARSNPVDDAKKFVNDHFADTEVFRRILKIVISKR